MQLTDLQTRGSTIIKVYFAMNSWQIMYQMLDEVYHLNIFWTRTHSLLTFGCSWMCASSQQASSPSREAAAAAALPSSCRAEWGSCKTPVASQGPGLKLPPRLFCFGEHLLKTFFWIHSRQETLWCMHYRGPRTRPRTGSPVTGKDIGTLFSPHAMGIVWVPIIF